MNSCVSHFASRFHKKLSVHNPSRTKTDFYQYLEACIIRSLCSSCITRAFFQKYFLCGISKSAWIIMPKYLSCPAVQ